MNVAVAFLPWLFPPDIRLGIKLNPNGWESGSLDRPYPLGAKNEHIAPYTKLRGVSSPKFLNVDICKKIIIKQFIDDNKLLEITNIHIYIYIKIH